MHSHHQHVEKLGLDFRTNDARLNMNSGAVNMTGKTNGVQTNVTKSVVSNHVLIERIHREGMQSDRALTLTLAHSESDFYVLYQSVALFVLIFLHRGCQHQSPGCQHQSPGCQHQSPGWELLFKQNATLEIALG